MCDNGNKGKSSQNLEVIGNKDQIRYTQNHNHKGDNNKNLLTHCKFLSQSNLDNKLNDDIRKNNKIEWIFGIKCKEEEFQLFCENNERSFFE
jgi:hypothetical protein